MSWYGRLSIRVYDLWEPFPSRNVTIIITITITIAVTVAVTITLSLTLIVILSLTSNSILNGLFFAGECVQIRIRVIGSVDIRIRVIVRLSLRAAQN